MTSVHGVADGRTWWHLGGDGWRTVLKRTGRQFGGNEVSNLAAVVTLRIVLALVPSMLAAVALAATLIDPSDIAMFVETAGDFVPESSRQFVTDQLESILDQLANGTVQVVGVAAGIFAASSAAVAMMDALNKAYGVNEKRSFLAKRTGSLVVLVALALALAGMFTAIVLGPSLLELLLPQQILDSPLSLLITIGRYVAGILVLILFFGFTYWFAPNRDRPKLRLLTPGAVLGVVGWLVLSYLFSLYARLSGSYSATYGVFAGIIVLLVWLNYSFTVLIMGAELDNEIEKYIRERGPDAVAEDSPTDVPDESTREPSTIGAVGGTATVAGVEDDHGLDTAIPVPPPAAVTPLLVGAAARSSGAGLARQLWRRLNR